MAEFPAMPLWTDAYLGDTGHLVDAEHGRYFLILIHLWRTPMQRLPNDDEWLARKFSRSVEAMNAEIKPIMREFLKCDGNWWTQKRLAKEWEFVSKLSQKRSAAAKTRWGNKKGASPAYAPTPTPTPTPESVGGGVGAASRAAPSGARSQPRTPPTDTDALRSSWNGNAGVLVDRIGPVKFQTWFSKAAFVPGPPVRIVFDTKFRCGWVQDHFRSQVEACFGTSAELVLSQEGGTQ